MMHRPNSKRSWSAGAVEAPEQDLVERLVVVKDGKEFPCKIKQVMAGFYSNHSTTGITQFFFFDGKDTGNSSR